mgnify:FL=1
MADIGRVRYTPYPANQSLQSSNAFCLHYYEELVLAQDAIGFFYPADLPEVQISLVLMPANYLYHRETNNHCETPTALNQTPKLLEFSLSLLRSPFVIKPQKAGQEF